MRKTETDRETAGDRQTDGDRDGRRRADREAARVRITRRVIDIILNTLERARDNTITSHMVLEQDQRDLNENLNHYNLLFHSNVLFKKQRLFALKANAQGPSTYDVRLLGRQVEGVH